MQRKGREKKPCCLCSLWTFCSSFNSSPMMCVNIPCKVPFTKKININRCYQVPEVGDLILSTWTPPVFTPVGLLMKAPEAHWPRPVAPFPQLPWDPRQPLSHHLRRHPSISHMKTTQLVRVPEVFSLMSHGTDSSPKREVISSPNIRQQFSIRNWKSRVFCTKRDKIEMSLSIQPIYKPYLISEWFQQKCKRILRKKNHVCF